MADSGRQAKGGGAVRPGFRPGFGPGFRMAVRPAARAGARLGHAVAAAGRGRLIRYGFDGSFLPSFTALSLAGAHKHGAARKRLPGAGKSLHLLAGAPICAA